MAVSPDGVNVYVAARNSNAVAVFRRNTTNGVLAQLAGNNGCVSEDGSGPCANGRGLVGPVSVAVSADGATVYVASTLGSSVAVFSRNTTTAPIGKLTQLAGVNGCVSEDGSSGECANGTALMGASSVAVSADNKSAHVASFLSDAVATFARNTSTAPTGKLTQLGGTNGCISETGTAGACVDGRALDGAEGVSLAGDGITAYVDSSNSDAVGVFSRNTTTGRLSQLSGTTGCWSETGTSGMCSNGTALDGAVGTTVSSDGKSVYAATEGSSGVAVFRRILAAGPH